MDLAPKRIVTVPRGSWKWQNAYRVVEYRVHKTNKGKYIWQFHQAITGKHSLPQLRRMGHGGLPVGGTHNHPLPQEMVDMIVQLLQLLPENRGLDWRPGELIPEDHHA